MRKTRPYHIGAGKCAKFLLTRGGSGVSAWGLDKTFDKRKFDIKRYKKLTIRAGKTILDSLVNVDDLQIKLDVLLGPKAMRLF